MSCICPVLVFVFVFSFLFVSESKIGPRESYDRFRLCPGLKQKVFNERGRGVKSGDHRPRPYVKIIGAVYRGGEGGCMVLMHGRL